MDVSSALMDLRIWIVAALVLAFVLDPLDLPVASITVVALMILTILSVDGIVIRKEDIVENRKGAIVSLLMCFVLNSGITLLCGLYFFDKATDIWYGWVMIAIMPCAVSTLSVPLIMKEDQPAALSILVVSYLSALVITPLMSMMIFGDAVSPLEILKYIIAFIVIPLLVSIPLRRLHLTRRMKVPFVNLMLATIIMLSFNTNRGFIFDSLDVIGVIIGLSVLRIALLHIVSAVIIRRMGLADGTYYTYLVGALWKNTGLAVSMCMAILTSMPEAALPGIICLLCEDIWFSFVVNGNRVDTGESKDTTY